MSAVEPVASRPWMPGYGISDDTQGLLPWSWAEAKLTTHRIYWIASTSPDGSPHAAPVWAVWIDGGLAFSTGAGTRKHRNLTADPRCVVIVDDGEESLSLHGRAEQVGLCSDPRFAESVAAPYLAKYATDITGMSEPLLLVRPERALAQIDREGEFGQTATRWTWPQ
jgi:hypothetical protein